MECYKYRNIEDYITHIKELNKKGIDYGIKRSEEVIRSFFRVYNDFVLYVNKETKSLKYGSSDYALERNFEIKEYKPKRTNLNVY